jgi:hypothetical protein
MVGRRNVRRRVPVRKADTHAAWELIRLPFGLNLAEDVIRCLLRR